MKKYSFLSLFMALPAFIYMEGDFIRRSFTKETISFLTLMFFFLFLASFLVRPRANALLQAPAKKQLQVHKIFGYGAIAFMLIHPILVVLPCFWEAGLHPSEALSTILGTANSKVIAGILAWLAMLALLLSAFFRSKMPFLAWKKLHRYLSLIIVFLASFHVLGLGRHMNTSMSLYSFFIIICACGSLLFKRRKIS